MPVAPAGAVDPRQSAAPGIGDGGASTMEAPMVERSHTAGWLPQVYAPLRKLGEKVTGAHRMR